MTNNLLNNESAIYVSIHVGGHIYETAQRTLRLKQHSVSFEADFAIPILDEFIVSKAVNQSSDVAPTESDKVSVMPVSLRVNRKGIMDSEVVAVGKMLIPVQSDLMDNIQVGLLTSEDNAEIAVATLSIQVNAVSSTSRLTTLLMEMESLMTQYTKTDHSQPLPILETFQVFLTTSTTLCDIWSMFRSILLWESYTRSLLFLFTIIALPRIGFPLALVITFFAAIAPSKPLPFLRFIKLKTSDDSPESIIESNLECLCELMQLARTISVFIDQTKSEILLLLGTLIYFIPHPIQTLFIVAMLANTFWWQSIWNLYVRRNRRHHSLVSEIPLLNSELNEFIVYEHQRWWLAKWSDKLIDNVPAWYDPSNPSDNCPRECFTLPEKCKWDGPWRVDTTRTTDSLTDPDGWEYAHDFNQSVWTFKRSLKDFVRRRKWTRKFTRI